MRLAFSPDQDSLVVDPGAVGLAVVAEMEDLAVLAGLEVEQPDLASAGMAFMAVIKHETTVFRKLGRHVAQALGNANDAPDAAAEIVQIEPLAIDRRLRCKIGRASCRERV